MQLITMKLFDSNFSIAFLFFCCILRANGGRSHSKVCTAFFSAIRTSTHALRYANTQFASM